MKSNNNNLIHKNPHLELTIQGTLSSPPTVTLLNEHYISHTHQGGQLTTYHQFKSCYNSLQNYLAKHDSI